MDESKSKLFDRLRREGQWAEASRVKDGKVKELRASGMTRAEASEWAWEAMAQEFPPPPAARQIPEPAAPAPDAGLSGSQTAASEHQGGNAHRAPAAPATLDGGVDIDALLDRAGDRPPPDLVRDTLWAYEHLANPRAKPGDAPSLGAWSLLQWARKYQIKFFEALLPKAMANKPPEDEGNIRQERRSIAEIERILEQFQEEEDEELRADVPGVLQQRVRGMLSSWGQQCGVSLAADSRSHLDSAIVGLIQDSLRAFAPASGTG
jgi:hypothetical protein